jgi:hypothetical protein
MEQSDYLLRQIQLMAQALAALIRRLTGLKEESSEEELKEATDVVLRDQMDLCMDDLISIPPGQVAEWLEREKNIHVSNMELLADVLLLNAGKAPDTEEKKKWLKAASALLAYVDEKGNIFSLERKLKTEEIYRLLNT